MTDFNFQQLTAVEQNFLRRVEKFNGESMPMLMSDHNDITPVHEDTTPAVRNNMNIGDVIVCRDVKYYMAPNRDLVRVDASMADSMGVFKHACIRLQDDGLITRSGYSVFNLTKFGVAVLKNAPEVNACLHH